MILVSNTGPIIALAKIDQLEILQRLAFAQVCIPPYVHKELFGKLGLETGSIETALDKFISVRQFSPNPSLELSTSHLDRGEQEVILLGADQAAEVTLLLDDQAGRRAAIEAGLPTVGTVGILLFAKEQGIVPAVIPLVEKIRQNGYWFSDALLEQVRRLTSE